MCGRRLPGDELPEGGGFCLHPLGPGTQGLQPFMSPDADAANRAAEVGGRGALSKGAGVVAAGDDRGLTDVGQLDR